MNAQMTIACGNTRIRSHVKAASRQHLNDLLYGIGVEYTNRPESLIDVFIDDAINASKLSQVVKWLNTYSI